MTSKSVNSKPPKKKHIFIFKPCSQRKWNTKPQMRNSTQMENEEDAHEEFAKGQKMDCVLLILLIGIIFT